MGTSKKSPIVGAMLALGAVAGVTPGTARALSCAGPNYLQQPGNGDVGVPTNALLWGYGSRWDRLLGPSGDVIDVDARALLVGSPSSPQELPVLVPRVNLEPDTEYTIVRHYEDEAIEDERWSFRTGAGPSSAPPPLPVLSASHTGVGSGFTGAIRYQTLEFEGFVERQLALLGDIADAEAPGESGIETLVSVRDILIDWETLPRPAPGPVLEWVAPGDALTVGIGDCLAWPSGAADHQDARFGAFDLAGNFSGWLAVPIDLPSAEEAQAVVDLEQAEREREQAEGASRNIQEPRSAVANCSTASPSRASRASHAAWLSLSLGLFIASARRRARR